VRTVRLREYGEAVLVPLPTSVGLALQKNQFVDATLEPATGLWRLRAAGKVGALRLGDVEVHVEPKVDIERLVFLLTYAPGRISWDERSVAVAEATDLVAALAEVFARVAERALLQGLVQGYRTVEESLPVVRGRIREAEQIRHRFALPLPIEVRYDDFTPDTPENRLLRAAVLRLKRIRGLPPAVRRRLAHLDLRLADVTPPVRGVPLEPWRPTRLNQRYQPALRLAEVVLRSSSFEPRADGLEIDGFVVDMAKVFEDFVCTALGDRLRGTGGRVRTQDHWHLDVGRQILMKPDLVWYSADGRAPRAVVDAKYKAEKPGGFPDADLYQVFAYATALRLRTAHLVYAKGNEEGRIHDVVNAGVRIVAHTLDLTAVPADLLAQVEALAGLIADTSTTIEGAA
jgi:5-methylcytosine-specific restriction enzyme subunit McrC